MTPSSPEPQHQSLGLVADMQVALNTLFCAEHPGTESLATSNGAGRCRGATPAGGG